MFLLRGGLGDTRLKETEYRDSTSARQLARPKYVGEALFVFSFSYRDEEKSSVFPKISISVIPVRAQFPVGRCSMLHTCLICFGDQHDGFRLSVRELRPQDRQNQRHSSGGLHTGMNGIPYDIKLNLTIFCILNEDILSQTEQNTSTLIRWATYVCIWRRLPPPLWFMYIDG